MAFKDGLPVASCLLEAAAWRYSVKVACGCGHVAIFDPHALWWRHEQNGWSGAFRDMQRRYFCSRCLARGGGKVRPIISAQGVEPPTVVLPMPAERAWKRARLRFRN